MIWKRLFFTLLFIYLVSLICLLKNQIYQALIPLAAGLLSFFLASFLFRSRIISVIFFVLAVVAVSQFAVTAKESAPDEALKQEFISDLVHGFKRTIEVTKEMKEAVAMAAAGDYSKLDTVHLRYATIVVVLPVGIFFLVFRRVPKRKEVNKQ